MLPAFSNSDTPTPEEAQGIVAAFFAQLPLFDRTNEDDATEGGQIDGEITAEAGLPDASHGQDRDSVPGIDLSALDQ